MPQLPEPLERLIQELSRLPGIGPKTAQRLAFHLLRVDRVRAAALAQAIEEVKARIGSEAFPLAVLASKQVTIVRSSHYHQFDTYWSFDDPDQGWLRFREDEFLDAAGNVTSARARLTLTGRTREEQFGVDFEAYARLEEAGQNFEYVLVTNEFDAARLSAACERRRPAKRDFPISRFVSSRRSHRRLDWATSFSF